MDFIVEIPRMLKGYTRIWEIVDRLTKLAQFLIGKATYKVDNWAQLYVKEIVRLHGVPVLIVLDRDPRFTSAFWRRLQKVLGTRLDFSTVFHPQTDGQMGCLNQILEDMSRTYILDFKGSWDFKLHLMERITIASKQLLEWHRSRPCMGNNVGPRYVGTRQVRES